MTSVYTLGIDIGSTTSKCVILEDGANIVASSLVVGGIGTSGPEQALSRVFQDSGLTREQMDGVAATGYGRNRCGETELKVSELTCHGLGAHFVFPQVRTIIDIGGQDAKVISLDDAGRMQNFLMNDKCEAGTGRFLDVMANILCIPVNDFGDWAAKAKAPASISSTCTVFAESEVISQLAAGTETADLVAGICASVAGRVASLAKRINIVPEVCMSGGVAQNSGVRLALAEAIGQPIEFSPLAQLFGALGAALYAYHKIK
ncbi:acyl-CoA dehydratase activase [Pseudoflavonifractor sp. An85]|uniref:acyl-CoA dehydratase activase n=1 Tax=Pseudoflavonifractor sp. An85 TaxID=1965661 RepID=UPI0031BA1EC0